jgi:hypothetical protein
MMERPRSLSMKRVVRGLVALSLVIHAAPAAARSLAEIRRSGELVMLS